MQSVVVDKIASVALAAELGNEIRISQEIPCEEGVLIAVEVLNSKSSYNTLELTSGRMAQVKQGDVLVAALGHRKALFGYSGHLPTKLVPGDTVQLLNLGGVVGICDSINPSHGKPFDCRVLGTVLDFPFLGERVGVPARVANREFKADRPLNGHGIPVVALAGTCMNSGKTAAACAVVSRVRHNGLVVDAFKATGVALRRDILAMEDAGARNISMFSDYGIVATTERNASALARNLLADLYEQKPDVIVCELGDGLLGAYGVQAILHDDEIRSRLTAVVLSANDPVSAWGGVKLLREEFAIEPAAVTGPATDNQVGIDIIRARSNVPAINAMSAGAELGDLLQTLVGHGQRKQEASA
jgi:molybdopterin-guanine dinucleotide biosynthesis protein